MVFMYLVFIVWLIEYKNFVDKEFIGKFFCKNIYLYILEFLLVI